MSDTTDTLDQPTKDDAVLKAVTEILSRLDGIEQKLSEHDLQFEAIRTGIVQNSVAFDRLNALVLNLRADVKELTEEVRSNQKTLPLR